MFFRFSSHPILHKVKKDRRGNCWLAKLSPSDDQFFNSKLEYGDLCESYNGKINCTIEGTTPDALEMMVTSYLNLRETYEGHKGEIANMFWADCRYIRDMYLEDLAAQGHPTENDPGNIPDGDDLWRVMALGWIELGNEITLSYSSIWDIEHPILVIIRDNKVASVEGR